VINLASEENYLENLKEFLKDSNYVKIFITLKRIFNIILETPLYNDFINNFVKFFYYNLDKFVEKEYNKKCQMRQIIQESLSQTIASKSEIEEFRKDEFIKEKIIELISKNLNIFHALLFDKSINDVDFKIILVNLILELYDRFPEISMSYFKEIFGNIIKTKIYLHSDLNIHLILDKMMDLSPNITLEIIFSWFEEFKTNNKSLFLNDNIILLEKIFQILRIYCEIYPEYFNIYLENLIQIVFDEIELIKSNDKNFIILNSFSYIVYYFSQKGEMSLIKYSKELIELSFISKRESQRFLFQAIYNLFNNYSEDIIQNIIEFNLIEKILKDVFELIANVCDQQTQDVLIDFYILIKIELKKINIGITKDIDNSKEFDLNQINSILNEYYIILKDISHFIKNNHYVLLKSSSEINSLVSILKQKYDLLNLNEKLSNLSEFNEKFAVSKFKKEIDIKKLFEEFLNFLHNLLIELNKISNQRN